MKIQKQKGSSFFTLIITAALVFGGSLSNFVVKEDRETKNILIEEKTVDSEKLEKTSLPDKVEATPEEKPSVVKKNVSDDVPSVKKENVVEKVVESKKEEPPKSTSKPEVIPEAKPKIEVVPIKITPKPEVPKPLIFKTIEQKRIPTFPKMASSQNDTGSAMVPSTAGVLVKNRIFLYESGQFPAQLFYYNVDTGEKVQLTHEGEEIFTSAILDSVSAVVYTVKSGSLKIVFLDDPTVVKVLSANGGSRPILDPSGKYLAYSENGALVVRDLSGSRTEIPTIAKLPLPDETVFGRVWAGNGQSIFFIKRDDRKDNQEDVPNPQSIIQYNLNDLSVKEIAGADTDKAQISLPFGDDRLFFLSYPNGVYGSDSIDHIIEINVATGVKKEHEDPEKNFNSYLVDPSGDKIYSDMTAYNEGMPSNRYLIGFGRTANEFILSSYGECRLSACNNTFYLYNMITKIETKLFFNERWYDPNTPSG